MKTTYNNNKAKNISTQIKTFWRDEEAATAVEYGLIAALIGAAIAGAVSALGGSLTHVFGTITGHINTLN